MIGEAHSFDNRLEVTDSGTTATGGFTVTETTAAACGEVEESWY